MLKTLRLGALALIGSVGLAACDPPPPPIPVDNRVVFSSMPLVGFAPFPFNFETTDVTVYADGRVIVGPRLQAMVFPGPALRVPTQMRISSAGVDHVRHLAQAAGLTVGGTLAGGACVADAGNIRYSLDGALTTVVSSGVECPQMSTEERARRAALSRLDETLFQAEATLASYVTEAPRPMTFDRMAIAYQAVTPDQNLQSVAGRPWPESFPRLGDSGATPVFDGFCEVHSGIDAVNSMLLAAQSTSGSVFTQGGTSYRVWFRPMKSSDVSCSPLVTGNVA